MDELVTLTTIEPSTELPEKLRYKNPNMACEILTSDVPALNERLASDASLLGKLHFFLESDPPLNSLLASYLSKILIKLVSQRAEQVSISTPFITNIQGCLSLSNSCQKSKYL